MHSLLVIGGLEANGFAGVLLDAAVLQAQGQRCASIITRLTAQNEQQVSAQQAVSAEVIAAQLEALLALPKVVKVGLLSSVAQAQVIRDWWFALDEKTRPKIIYDPVSLSSSNNRSLLDDDYRDIVQTLLPCVYLLTPNRIELQQLTDAKNSQLAMQRLTKFAPCHDWHCLLKGGHEQSDQPLVNDQLWLIAEQGGQASLVAQWWQGKHSFNLRGTGCLLGSVIASELERGNALLDAITVANAAVQARFAEPLHLPVANQLALERFPRVALSTEPKEPALGFPPMQHSHGLYVIVDSLAMLESLLLSGVKTFQLRIKKGEPNAIKAQIKQAVALAKRYDVQLFINDYWQWAIEAGAYGVHLGQEDLNVADIAAIANNGLRLGVSTHGEFELLRALQYRPSYVAVGAIFPTQTKDMTGKIQGIERLARFRGLVPNVPMVAIGGINISNIDRVKTAGVNWVAVVSAVTQAEQPEVAARGLNQRLILEY